MPALRLDYQRPYRPIPWPGLCILAMALGGAVQLYGHYRALDRDIALWEDRAERIERLYRRHAAEAHPVSVRTARQQVLEVEQANQVLRLLGVPWNAMFRAVESAGGRTVALLSMEPDVQKGLLRISGEARDFPALRDYARRLGRNRLFAAVQLQSHQVQRDAPEQPVRFTLLASWAVEAP